MSIDQSRLRGGTRHRTHTASPTTIAGLGSRFIQLANAITDQDTSKWVETSVRFLRAVTRRAVDRLSELRTKKVMPWRRKRARRRHQADEVSMPVPARRNLARVERGNAISREDASLEVFAAIEHERERIGRDLHDGLGQLLTAVGFMSSALHHSLRATNHPDAPSAEALSAAIHRISGETRKLVRGVAKSPVEPAGLALALRELCADINRWLNVDCQVECDELLEPDVAKLPVAVGTELYRIAQEAVTSAVRQSHDSQVRIRLSKIEGGDHEPALLALSIEHGGPKIAEPSRALSNTGRGDVFGMGKEIMRSRAQSIGATLLVSHGGSGESIVTCVVTMAEESSPLEASRHRMGREMAMKLRVATVEC